MAKILWAELILPLLIGCCFDVFDLWPCASFLTLRFFRASARRRLFSVRSPTEEQHISQPARQIKECTCPGPQSRRAAPSYSRKPFLTSRGGLRPRQLRGGPRFSTCP